MGKADKAGGADNMGKVDKNVVRNKLDSLARCLLHIEEDRPATVEDLMEDFRLQNSIVLELQRAVQICVDVG
ncbi:MAG: hypothetical protein LBP68_02165, partial [Acidobacteriota bacterium]|nr:hypothetical protein [Acidobacteriota bacterium]